MQQEDQWISRIFQNIRTLTQNKKKKEGEKEREREREREIGNAV